MKHARGVSLLGHLAVAFLLLSAAFPIIPAQAEPEKLRFGIADSFYPSGYRDENGRMAGSLVRMLALISKTSGVPIEVEGYPWPRTQKMVQSGELDAFAAADTKERRTYAVFAPTPILTAPNGIIYRTGNDAVAHVASMDQLTRLRLGTYLGNSWVKEHFPPDSITWARTYDNLLHLIEADRVDFTICDEASAAYRIKTAGLEGQLAFRPLPFLAPLEYRFGLRRGHPGAEALIARMEKAIVAAHNSPGFAAAAAPFR